MKYCLVLFLAVAVVAAVALPAVPLEEGEPGVPLHELESHSQGSGLRFKRATCDLGSFQSEWFTPNHALCAAHCLTMRYKGGYCQGTICHCRDKF